MAVWTAGPPLPVATSAAAVADYGGTLYLFGGYQGTQASSSVYQLASSATAWAAAAPLNQSQAGGGVGETGYLGLPPGDGGLHTDIVNFGGISGGEASAAVYNYGSETPLASMPAPLSFFAYAADPGDTGSTSTDYLYAVGGLNGSNQAVSTVQRFDVTTSTWTTLASLPQALSHATAADDGAGHIFVFGGLDSAGAPVSTVYRYTVATDTWDTAAAMPLALSDASALYGAYGLIYVIGGRSSQGAVATVEDFNPVSNTWTADAALPAPVYDAATAIDANGNINVIGGIGASNAAVTSVWTTPVGQTPPGLPAYPKLTFPVSTYVYNFFTYNGTQEQATAFAFASDGVTPVAGSFTYTYNGSSAPPSNAGTYQVLAHFTSADPGYTDAYIAGQLVIQKAFPTITVTGAGTYLYDAQPHPVAATEVGINGKPISGSFSYAYNGSSSPPVAPGTYSAVATFNSSDPNYNSWTDPAPGIATPITVTIPDPTIPTGLTITPVSTTSLTLAWNAAWEANSSLTPASSYNVYERFWHPGTHSPRGSGGTPGYYYYVAVATGVTGTSYTFSGLSTASYSSGSHTYAVTSVGPTGVESTKSALITGQAKYAPSFAYSLVGGALINNETVEVGQTANATMQFYGNEPPTITMLSGPSTMSIDPSTGVISYTPAASEYGHGPVTATFQAANSLGTATASFTFNVIARPTLVVTGGTFPYDGNVHPATAVAYGVDGVTPVAGTIRFTYSPQQYPTAQSTAPYAEVGTYIVTATFISSDANYGGASATGTLITIVPVAPTVVIDVGPFGYTGAPQPVTAAAYGVDGVSPVNGTFSFTYDGSATPPTAPGTYQVVASFTVTPNPYVAWLDYTDTTATGTMVILPNSAVTVQSGTVGGAIQGAVSLVKTGSGAATLIGPNSYTGGTYVPGGTLIVTDPTGLPDGGMLVVGSAGAFSLPTAAATVAASAAVSASTRAVAAPMMQSNAAPSGIRQSAATAPTAGSSPTAHGRAILALLSASKRTPAAAIVVDATWTLAAGSASDTIWNRSRDALLLSRTARND